LSLNNRLKFEECYFSGIQKGTRRLQGFPKTPLCCIVRFHFAGDKRSPDARK
jgi:hypothetical protein